MDAKQYWDSRYKNGGDSGYGSYGAQLIKKLQWLSGLDIESISEIGCGDFNFGSHLLESYPSVTYIGQDISKYIIQENREVFKQTFTVLINEVPAADLVLCVDVIFHVLNDKELEKLVKQLENRWVKYLAITAYEEGQLGTADHVRVQKFDYKRFGEPIMREVVEEDGQLYFYLFKK